MHKTFCAQGREQCLWLLFCHPKCNAEFKCSDRAILLNHHISTALVRCHSISGRPLRGLSPICFITLKMPDPMSYCTHINGMLLVHTLFRCLWISMELTSAAVRNSVATLCFICVSVTSAILNCLCFALMWPILAPLTRMKLQNSTAQSVTRASWCSAEFQRKKWRN
jgi:hypothetical protein